MLILMHASGFNLDSKLRAEITEKIELSFARFSSKIGKIDAFLADLNGPKNGIDKSMRLLIDVKRSPTFVVVEKGESWLALIESIADRASQTLAKKIKRSRSLRNRTRISCDQRTFEVVDSTSADEGWNPSRMRLGQRVQY